MATVTTRHNFVHHAPRKLRLIADTVRGLPAERAAAELSISRQAASQIVRKVILSAIAAAKAKDAQASDLFIQHVTVDEGPKMRRFIPMSRGRSQRIVKQMSHVTISLTDEPTLIQSSKVYKREIGKQVTRKVSTTKTDKQVADPSVEAVTEKPKSSESAPASTAEGSK